MQSIATAELGATANTSKVLERDLQGLYARAFWESVSEQRPWRKCLKQRPLLSTDISIITVEPYGGYTIQITSLFNVLLYFKSGLLSYIFYRLSLSIKCYFSIRKLTLKTKWKIFVIIYEGFCIQLGADFKIQSRNTKTFPELPHRINTGVGWREA